MSNPFRKLEQAYRTLPALECKGLCQECCGPVVMTRKEWKRITDHLGHTPEAREDLVCPMLDEATGKCSVYEIRPAICRLWGIAQEMPCPHGCRPERTLNRQEGYAFLKLVETAGR